MLFSVYARYVPNLTRKDGSAMEPMLAAKITRFHGEISTHQEPEPAQSEIASSEAAFWDQFITSPASHSHNPMEVDNKSFIN